jgi:hypothetical protein
MLLYLKKHFIVIKIFGTKFSRVHLDTLCAYAKFWGKRIYFVSSIKEINDMSQEEFFLALNFIFLHTTKKVSFCETTLQAYRMLRYMHGIFFKKITF